jgi:hypothetical protein
MLDKHGHAYTENVVWLELSLHRRIAMQVFVLGSSLNEHRGHHSVMSFHQTL